MIVSSLIHRLLEMGNLFKETITAVYITLNREDEYIHSMEMLYI